MGGVITDESHRPSLSSFLRDRQGDILEEWAKLARGGGHLTRDAIPTLLDWLAEELQAPAGPLAATLPEELAERYFHRLQDEGIGLLPIIVEYGVLHDGIVRTWGKVFGEEIPPRERRALKQAVDGAIAASHTLYSRSRRKALDALDRVSVSTLESEDIPTFLLRILRLLEDAVPAIDSATVYQREGALLRRAASVGAGVGHVLAETYRVGEGLPGAIVLHDRPGRRADAELAPLRSLHGVPLVVDGEVQGALILGSLTASALSEQDQELILTVASRAAPGFSLHRVHAETRGRAQTLQEAREQLHAILDSTAEGIYGLDEEGRCVMANRACVELLGYATPDDLLGKPLHELIHHTRADGTPYPLDACPTSIAYRTGQPRYAADEVLWRRDGTSIHAELRSHPMIRDGAIVGAVVTFLDVTEPDLRAELAASRAGSVALCRRSDELLARLAGPKAR
jgi:PAS domain S-box-containing protein